MEWRDLSSRERELAILAVARTLRSRYEWNIHVELGRDFGVTDDELESLSLGDDCGFSQREQAIMRYASAVVTDAVTNPIITTTIDAIDVETTVGLTLLASHYLATARFLSALRVPIDDKKFVG